MGHKWKNHVLKKMITSHGYVQRFVGKDHYLADGKGCAYEHRLVAEEKLGRRLEPGEVVHHVDEDKTNNDPGNLEVYPSHHAHNVQHRKNRNDFRMPGEDNKVIPCLCGCGETFKKFDESGRPRKYVSGHNPTKSPESDAVLKVLTDSLMPIRVKDVAEIINKPPSATQILLTRLVKAGQAHKAGRGLYGIRKDNETNG